MNNNNIRKISKHKNIIEQSFDILGRIPPQAIDIEEAVIGAIIMEVTALDDIIKDLTPELFYKDAHQRIVSTIIKMYQECKKIDILTLTNQLKEDNLLELVGGPFYIATLTNKIASGVNVEFYIKIIQQKYLSRTIIQKCSTATKQAYSDDADIFDVISELQNGVDSDLSRVLKYDIQMARDINKTLLDDAFRIATEGCASGVLSGFEMLDNITSGFQKSDFIVIAGRPSMGKTALAISLSVNAAIKYKSSVAVFSLEMSKEQLMGRIQSILSEINVSRIIKKQTTIEELHIIAKDCLKLANAQLFIDDKSLSLLELRAKARRLVKEHGVQLLIIDYLQLMHAEKKTGNREQEVSDISKGLKALAKELNIPIIALSQLSRTVESRADKKPLLSDLRESGQIEADADMVAFCFRPEYYKFSEYVTESETFVADGLFMLIIAKHRNGALGEVPLKFIPRLAKVCNYNFYEEVEDKEKKDMPKSSNFESKFEEEDLDSDTPF